MKKNLIFALFAVVCPVSVGCASPAQKGAAENEARQYATDLGIVIDGVSCANVDSDNDGYVSCTVRSGTELHQIECRGAFSFGHGCRTPKLNVRGNPN